MPAWPTQTAIHAATHGTSARNAERRARLEATENALHFSLCLLIITAQGRRLPIHAISARINSGCRAAHRAVGA